MNRATALRQAETLLRNRQTDAAIALYAQVIEAEPRDWNTANLLGDLYLRAGRPERAVDQFVLVADGLAHEGFVSKAAALYRKALRVRPDNESVLLKVAGIAAGQGLFASARAYLTAVVRARLDRGDEAGASEVSRRLAALELGELWPPAPVTAFTAARAPTAPVASVIEPPDAFWASPTVEAGPVQPLAIRAEDGPGRVGEAPLDLTVVAVGGDTPLEGPDDQEIDLTPLLDRPPSEAVAPLKGDDLDSVFEELRSASRSSGNSEAPDATYARGLASYAAGAIDECLADLRSAARAPHLRFGAASLLGRIWRSRGELVEAVEWFERAAEAPAPSLDESWRLLYDLADALEQAGERARALAVLLELQADAARYRDVGARIDRLLM